MKALSQFLTIVLFTMQTSAHFHIDYDRCDDLCRVLGHNEGGSCDRSDRAEAHCICQPDDVDVTDYLPSVCQRD